MIKLRINGEYEFFSNREEVLDSIEKHMGSDVREFMKKIMDDNTEMIEAVQSLTENLDTLNRNICVFNEEWRDKIVLRFLGEDYL